MSENEFECIVHELRSQIRDLQVDNYSMKDKMWEMKKRISLLTFLVIVFTVLFIALGYYIMNNYQLFQFFNDLSKDIYEFKNVLNNYY